MTGNGPCADGGEKSATTAKGLVQSSDTVLSYPSQMNVHDCNRCLQVKRQPCLTSYFFCSDLGLHT